MDADLHVSTLKESEETDLLNHIYGVLQSPLIKPIQRATTIQLLEDFCYQFRSLPTSLKLYNIRIMRSEKSERGGSYTRYRGEMAGQEVTVYEPLTGSKDVDHGSLFYREIVESTHTEAIILSQLHHPNIIGFLGVYEEAPTSLPTIVSAFVEGHTLHDILEAKKPLAKDQFLRIVTGVTEAVHYLHSFCIPVVHGCICSQDIMTDPKGNPYIIGFSRSRICREVTGTKSPYKIPNGGWYRFQAPELINGPFDSWVTTHQSDIYGLAMVIYHTWTGHRPFDEIRHEWMMAASLAKRPSIRPSKPPNSAGYVALPQEVEEALWSLIVQMWDENPAKRPSSEVVLGRITEIFRLVQGKFF
ncbi:kinase-like protein [Clavulina sp. PMI_390]|nr:kinase-like protein [Clavulina sp. PMI_390]